MKMFVAGRWFEKTEKLEVRNPFDNSLVDTVPKADGGDVEAALVAAVEGARIMRAMPAYERYRILSKASQLMRQRQADLARTLTLEEGKVLRESTAEVARAAEVIELSAEEAKPRWRIERRRQVRFHHSRALWRSGGNHAV
jgi:glyceraldehyde-3-phosphate dehydrogenase (NADP+)